MLDRADGGVIALGGGAVLSERTRAALRRHTVVLVDVDLETAWSRAAGEGRPLARDRDAFARLFAGRAALYEDAADAIVPGTGDPHVVRRALPALRAAPAGLMLLWATSASGDYPGLDRRGRGRAGAVAGAPDGASSSPTRRWRRRSPARSARPARRP